MYTSVPARAKNSYLVLAIRDKIRAMADEVLEKPAKKARKPRKKLKLFIGFTVLALIVAAGLLYGIHILRGPAEGTVIQTSAADIVKAPDGVINSTYFTANYPGRYSVVQDQNTASASLKSWTLYAHQVEGVGAAATLSIIVTNLPKGGVTEDSAYSLYKARSDIYKLTTGSYKNESVYIAKRTDPSYQYTVLWAHKPYLLTTTITAGNESDLVNSDIQNFLRSVKWE